MPPPTGTVCQKFGREYVDEFQRRHAVKTFSATADTPIEYLNAVLGFAGIPSLGESYSLDDILLKCTSREVREMGRTNIVFEVICQYDMNPYNCWGVKLTTQTVDYVLDRTLNPTTGVGIPYRFSNDPTKYVSTEPSGLAEELVLNRAKDPFDPPVMTQRYQTVINLTNLVHDITDLGFLTIGAMQWYLGKMNSEKIQLFSIPDESNLGCDYWTLLIEDMQFEKLPKPDGDCDLAVSIKIVYDRMNHCQAVLNAGYNELVGTPPKRRKCRDAGMVEVSAPVPLGLTGKMLEPISIPSYVRYIMVPDHEAVPFNVFNFPPLFCGLPPVP